MCSGSTSRGNSTTFGRANSGTADRSGRSCSGRSWWALVGASLIRAEIVALFQRPSRFRDGREVAWVTSSRPRATADAMRRPPRAVRETLSSLPRLLARAQLALGADPVVVLAAALAARVDLVRALGD